MYCIKCGVELADSEKKCPLCGTVVFNPELSRPDGEPQYPRMPAAHPEKVNHSGIMFVVTMLFLLPIVTTLLCDWQINGEIIWSGYAVGAVILLYTLVVLPLWFRHPNPAIFVPVDFAAIALFLLYINFAVGGHWFLSFAFPVTGAIALLVTAVVTLMRYVPGGALYIFGGALILTGGLNVLIEFLLHITFGIEGMFVWSIYPLTVCVLLGVMLLVVAVCKPLRRSLHRKFFL